MTAKLTNWRVCAAIRVTDDSCRATVCGTSSTNGDTRNVVAMATTPSPNAVIRSVGSPGGTLVESLPEAEISAPRHLTAPVFGCLTAPVMRKP